MPRVLRPATPDDGPALEVIEAAADTLFDGVLELPPATGRAAELGAPGFALVAVDADDRPLGFAHVLELDARFHLEQLSVHPDAQRRGLGAALLLGPGAGGQRRTLGGGLPTA